MLEGLLQDFMSLVEEKKIEIYNEFSLQHELGIFLRENLKEYKVEFERNVKFFGLQGTTKHEIDIVIYNKKEKYAIELKHPLNGQHPEQMFSFIKDICFMEELEKLGFNKTYCLTVVTDKNFYSGEKKDGIYSFFRGGKIIKGKICKPTGKKDELLEVKNEYAIKWQGKDIKYYIIQIGENSMKNKEKKYKYMDMAEVIRDYLISFQGTKKIVRLTAKEARQLDGMDNYAANTCYNNVCRAMEYVAEEYVYGNVVTGTEKGKGNSTYALDYEVDRLK